MTKLTLDYIAKKAGVSPATVSRVLNDYEHVSEEVRQRVKNVIIETGYRPNFAARSLASNKSNIIGLILPQSVRTLFTDPYFSLLVQGVSQACGKHKYLLSLFIVHDEQEEREMYQGILQQGLLAGMIVQAAQIGDPLIPKLVESNMPLIIAGEPQGLPNANFIDFDNIGGAYTATVHLIKNGYKRIAIITGSLNQRAGVNRLEGYKNALNDYGFPINNELIFDGKFSEEAAYNAGKEMLSFKPDAVFICSDSMALSAIRAFQEEGINVPNDIAVVGYDDLPIAAMSRPPLTTVRQPIINTGIMLVNNLIKIIDGKEKSPIQMIFNTELVVRDSCGMKKKIKL